MVFPGNGIVSLPVRIDTYFCDDRFDIKIHDVLCNIRFSRRVANRPDLVEAFPGTDLFFRFFPCQGGSGMPFLAACLMAGLFPAVIGIGWFSALLVCRRGLWCVGAVIIKDALHPCIIITQESVFLFQMLVFLFQAGNFIIEFFDLLFGLLLDSIKAFHNLHKLII